MTMSDTRPTFSRLTEGRATQSWRSAIPAVLVVVGFVALLLYLASALSSAESRAMNAERDASQNKESSEALVKRISAMQNEQALLETAGRTTVILQPGKSDKTETWAAVTWGEQPDGHSYMRGYGYGLQKLDDNKSYHLWLLPKDGSPIDLGALEDANGSGFVMKTDLPPVDQGKTAELTIDDDNAKQPGDVVATADLPNLEPTTMKPAASSEPGQAKSGNTSQQMHQGK